MKWSKKLNRLFAFLLVGTLFFHMSVFTVAADITDSTAEQSQSADTTQTTEESTSNDTDESNGAAEATDETNGTQTESSEETDSTETTTEESEETAGAADETAGTQTESGEESDGTAAVTEESEETAGAADETAGSQTESGEESDGTEAATEESEETAEATDETDSIQTESSEESDGTEVVTEESEEIIETTEEADGIQTESVEEIENTGMMIEEELDIRLSILSTELSDGTVIVSSYAELAAALSEDNGYEYIYLAGDITQSSSNEGIVIHESKSSVVIDGLAPDEGSMATFTQRASSTFGYTIRVLYANSVTKSVTLRNLNIVGQNYYGIVSAEDSVSGLELYYENINYTGPQITYNRNGSAHYSDSNISIVSASANGGSLAQEVAEASAVSFSGNVTIQSASTSNSVFWLVGTSTSFSLEADTSLSVTTNNYFIYADGSYPVMNLYEGASMQYAGAAYGLLYSAQRLQSLHLYDGAVLSVTQNTNSFGYGTLRIHSELTLDAGSSLTVVRSTGGPAIQMVGSGATVNFTEPERVKLYAPASKLIAFVYTGTLSITADAVNIWTTAGGFTNDSISNAPGYHWNKASGELLEISSGFSGTTQTLSSNLTGSDPTDNLTSSSFALGNAQMLVLGRFDLTVHAVYENSSAITGTTEQNAELQASNLTQSGTLLNEGSASGTAYSLSVSAAMQNGDILAILSYHDYLRKIEHVTVGEAQETGRLQLKYVPSLLNFGSIQMPGFAGIIERPDNDVSYIEVEDSRSSSSGWSLIVSLSAPLTSADGNILNNALVYADGNGSHTAINESGLLIQSGSGSGTTLWSESQGILLWADPNEIVSNQSYSGTINWSLQDAP